LREVVFFRGKNKRRLDFMKSNSHALYTLFGGVYPSEPEIVYAISGVPSPRESTALVRRASQAAVKDKCCAALACSSIQNVALLSDVAAHCFRVAPHGEDSYKKIVAAYATVAAMNIYDFWRGV
jgi:hypothetical protein